MSIGLSLKHSALLFIATVLSISTAAAAGPPKDINTRPPGDKTPEQAPDNHSNKTGGGPLSVIPGLGNGTMPDLPSQASNVAKTVTSTIGNAFEATSDFIGGIGSFLSDALPVVGGPETGQQPEQPVNGTNSTQQG